MSGEPGISRREMIARGIGTAGLFAASGSAAGGQETAPVPKDGAGKPGPLRAKEVDDVLKSLDPAARGDSSPDGLIWGDLETEVRAVGTTWMASLPVLKAAVAKGINLVVAHEPTFWFHGTPRRTELQLCEQNKVDISFKTRFLADNRMVVIRAHNCWDRYPKAGIEASLQSALEFPDPAEYLGGYHNLYRIPGTTLEKLARLCKARTGMPWVRVSGELAKTVEKVVLAYGSSSSTESYYRAWKRGADAVISGEECEWSTVRPAIDMGLGVIELGHSNSEGFGMEGLARLLNERFPGARVEYLPTGDSFQYV